MAQRVGRPTSPQAAPREFTNAGSTIVQDVVAREPFVEEAKPLLPQPPPEYGAITIIPAGYPPPSTDPLALCTGNSFPMCAMPVFSAAKPSPITMAGAVAPLAVDRTVAAATPQRLPISLTDEPPLLAALRCFLEKRPGDAPKELGKVDEATRDILMTLMPLTVRVSEAGVSNADPKEIALVVDQLQGMLWSLRPKAALVMDKFCFCRQIRRFGVFEALEVRPSFQPGEMIEIYAEIRNVASKPHRGTRGDYRTHLRSALDIRRPTGESAWQAPQFFDKPDDTMTPQHDYFQHYRLQMPNLELGCYSLHLEVVDVPTGRKVEQKLEFTIGPAGKTARSE